MSEKALKLLNDVSILIAEDDEIAINVIKNSLKPHCKALHCAKDGMQALELFNKFNADIIMTDIHMPIMNGFDMMKAVLKLKPHQKFLVFTSFDSDDNLIKSLEQGAMMFLKKPIDMQELYRALITLNFRSKPQLIALTQSVSIDLQKERIYKDGVEVYLSFLQNKFFWLLAYNLNNLVTYEMVEEFVYEYELVNKNAIQKLVYRLKIELGVEIKNIFESGYIMTNES
ncbi:response regulator transcription factor [Campylobacter suis]|uniref:Response regulator MprA n=1 Tax=Campylobacter suis TaxID=2790657 RepID=A0ABN7K9V8_9BACT|nr:response regulator [Campylobacter suis]CAD7289303.1 Response regulator MprA [Campylobacter suis]